MGQPSPPVGRPGSKHLGGRGLAAWRRSGAANFAALGAATTGAWALGYVVGLNAPAGPGAPWAAVPAASLLTLGFARAAGWTKLLRLRRVFGRASLWRSATLRRRAEQAGAAKRQAVAPAAATAPKARERTNLRGDDRAASRGQEARGERSAKTHRPAAHREAEAALPQATDALLRVLGQVLAPCQVGLMDVGPDGQLVLRASAPAAAGDHGAVRLGAGAGAEVHNAAAPSWPPATLLRLQEAAQKLRQGTPREAVTDLHLAPILEAPRAGSTAAATQTWGLLAVLRPVRCVWSHSDVALVEGVAAQLALAWGLEQALRTSRRHLQRLERIATTDGLTELCNQRHFTKLFDLQLARARRYGRRLSLIFLDIDHFKEVNDTHGHQAGDAVLKKVAEVLRDTARCTDTVARLGGEEFAVLMEETGAKGAERYAERIRQALGREVFTAQGGAFRKTCSLGVATFPEHGELAKDLMAHADEALYLAKRSGRNRTVLYSVRPPGQESSP